MKINSEVKKNRGKDAKKNLLSYENRLCSAEKSYMKWYI